MAGGLGEAGVNEDDFVAEGGLEDGDELGGEGDFGDEEDDGLASLEGLAGELEVDVGFAGAGDAVEEAGGGRGVLERGEGGELGGVEGNFGGLGWIFGILGIFLSVSVVKITTFGI